MNPIDLIPRNSPTNTEKTAAFDYLAHLARDPFAQVEHASDPAGALARAGLVEGDMRREMASAAESQAGSWASCQTCSDPGPDRHPDK